MITTYKLYRKAVKNPQDWVYITRYSTKQYAMLKAKEFKAYWGQIKVSKINIDSDMKIKEWLI